MAGNKMICTTKNVDYSTIRKAMCQGVRTIEELVEKTGICTTCKGCTSEINQIISSVCGCKGVSLNSVVKAVKKGANTIEKVGEVTGAGNGEGCGRCKLLIANIIEIGR